MIRGLLLYLVIGLVYALIHGYAKEEKRFSAFVATLTGWPFFLLAAIGAGWDALLNRRQE